ncbi:hypothetical protein ANANG_G00209270, partial [Anguilla anguilla]
GRGQPAEPAPRSCSPFRKPRKSSLLFFLKQIWGRSSEDPNFARFLQIQSHFFFFFFCPVNLKLFL